MQADGGSAVAAATGGGDSDMALGAAGGAPVGATGAGGSNTPLCAAGGAVAAGTGGDGSGAALGATSSAPAQSMAARIVTRSVVGSLPGLTFAFRGADICWDLASCVSDV